MSDTVKGLVFITVVIVAILVAAAVFLAKVWLGAIALRWTGWF